jgi:Rha family phage regulatory protein
MSQLVFVEKNQAVTDSLTVAEVFGKTHDNVLRDIRNQVEKLIEAGESEFTLLNFEECDYINTSAKGINKNRKYKKILLTEEAFTLVAFAYITPEAMKMKVKFIQEFKRMRQELQELLIPSYMIGDPIKRAEKWIEEQRATKALETKTAVLEQQIAEYEPKLNYLDTILNSKDTVTISQIAEDYGKSASSMNKLLHQHGIQYKINGQWLLYSKHKGLGYTKSKPIDIKHTDGSYSVKLNTRWTQKGRLFIYETLKKHDVLPLMDIQLNKQVDLVGTN